MKAEKECEPFSWSVWTYLAIYVNLQSLRCSHQWHFHLLFKQILYSCSYLKKIYESSTNIKERIKREVQDFYFIFKKHQRPICCIKELLPITNIAATWKDVLVELCSHYPTTIKTPFPSSLTLSVLQGRKTSLPVI